MRDRPACSGLSTVVSGRARGGRSGRPVGRRTGRRRPPRPAGGSGSDGRRVGGGEQLLPGRFPVSAAPISSEDLRWIQAEECRGRIVHPHRNTAPVRRTGGGWQGRREQVALAEPAASAPAPRSPSRCRCAGRRGLVVQLQSAVRQRVPQLAQQPEPVHPVSGGRAVVEVPAIAAAGLRLVHGHIGVVQQRLGGWCPVPYRLPITAAAARGGARVRSGDSGRVGEGDTDAGGDDDVEPADLDRVGERPEYPLGEIDRRELVREVLGDNDELVAPEPGDDVTVADRAAQPVGDLGRAPGRVSEAVVDCLELVEVDEQQPDRAGGTGLAGQRLPDALQEQGPVRQPGQRVVPGQPGQLDFGPLAGGDIGDEGERSKIAAVVGDDRAGRDVCPQLAAVPAAELNSASCPRRIRDFRDRPRHVQRHPSRTSVGRPP